MQKNANTISRKSRQQYRAARKVMFLLIPLFFICGVATCAAAQMPDPKPGDTPVQSKAAASPTPGSAQSPLVKVADGRWVAPELARIINRGALIVALHEKDTPPFVFEKDGVMSGLDIEIVQQIGEQLKVQLQFDRSAKTYDEVVQRVANGQADVGVSKLARTLKRAESVLFSDPYMRLQHALLINRVAFADMARDQKVVPAVRNFTGSIGVLAGSAWEEFAKRNFTKATIVPFKTWGQAVDAAKQGKVVAAYRDGVEVRSIMAADPRLALTMRTVGLTDLASILCVVVGTRDHVLRSLLNEIIANQKEPPTVEGLLKTLAAKN